MQCMLNTYGGAGQPHERAGKYAIFVGHLTVRTHNE